MARHGPGRQWSSRAAAHAARRRSKAHALMEGLFAWASVQMDHRWRWRSSVTVERGRRSPAKRSPPAPPRRRPCKRVWRSPPGLRRHARSSAHRDMLAAVLRNLVSNAVKFSRGRGRRDDQGGAAGPAVVHRGRRVRHRGGDVRRSSAGRPLQARPPLDHASARPGSAAAASGCCSAATWWSVRAVPCWSKARSARARHSPWSCLAAKPASRPPASPAPLPRPSGLRGVRKIRAERGRFPGVDFGRQLRQFLRTMSSPGLPSTRCCGGCAHSRR